MSMLTRIALAMGLVETRPIPRQNQTTIFHVPKGMEIQGPILSQHDVVIEGLVKGNISCPGNSVTILEGGCMRGGILHAQSLFWVGELSGTRVHVESLRVADSATNAEDCTTPQLAYEHLVIEPGVQIDAHLRHQRFERASAITDDFEDIAHGPHEALKAA